MHWFRRNVKPYGGKIVFLLRAEATYTTRKLKAGHSTAECVDNL